MLLSHRKKFIYTKTVKTAGTSVESYFEKYCMPEGEWEFLHNRDEYESETGIIGYRGLGVTEELKWYNHMPAANIKCQVGDEIWNSYFKFCIVRNPFDKLVSYFNMQEMRLKTDLNLTLKKKFKFFLQNLLKTEKKNKIKRFKKMIKSDGLFYDGNKYLINEQICVDYFILYEDLENGIKHVCNYLDIPFEPENIPLLKAENKHRDISLEEYYDNECIEIVKNLYKLEIEKFGYKPPESLIT